MAHLHIRSKTGDIIILRLMVLGVYLPWVRPNLLPVTLHSQTVRLIFPGLILRLLARLVMPQRCDYKEEKLHSPSPWTLTPVLYSMTEHPHILALKQEIPTSTSRSTEAEAH